MDRDHTTAAWLYAWVAEHLRLAVQTGRYRPGDRLPAEVTLAQQLGVARGTIRHALADLVADGLIATVPGQGSFVCAPEAAEARLAPGPAATSPRQERVAAVTGAAPAGLIGLILPSVVRARNPELIDGAEEVCRQAHCSLVLGSSGDDRQLEAEQLERMLTQGASGLIVYTVDGPLEAPALRRLVERGSPPLVLIDRYLPDLAVDTVCMDNVGGGFLAVQHLIERGYRRIGYIGTDNTGTSSIVERMAGYRWALDQYGLPYDPGLVCTTVRRLLGWPPREPDKEQHNQRVLRAYLGGDPAARPQAVFVCNDYVAFQVVQVADGLGLRIPDDLALVAFDNVVYRDYFGVPLSTIDQRRHEIGATAARLLLERIAGQRTRSERIVIATQLIVRQSSGQLSDRPVQAGLDHEGSTAHATVGSSP